jgi:hypothetical protein
MGISAQQLVQSDPEFLQRQLAQQEMQRLNPQNTAAGAIGALLGRGIGNVSAGRGFFDINDAGLRRVADVQRIMSQTEFDPNNPAGYYENIAKSLQQSGYGDLAPMALQQSSQLRREQERANIERQRLEFENKRIGFEQERLTQEKYRNNPQLLLTDALQLPEDSPQRIAMLTQYSNIAADRNFSIAKREADLRNADAELQRLKADTARIQAIAQREGEAGIVGKPGPVGKAGGYRDIDGQIYTPAGMTKQRDEFKQLGIMLEKVNKITDMDVINAQSIFDYTQEGGVIKGVAGSLDEKTVGAQSRIAASQLLEQINSLPPGAASDADMRAAKAAFPGYGSVANLVSWINDTKATLAKYYNDSAERFGFPKKVTPTAPLTGKRPKKQGGQTGEWAIIGVQPRQSGQ